MAVNRVDDVLGFEALAIMKLDTLAQLECPLACIGGRLPALREVRTHVAVGHHLGHVVAALPVRVFWVCVDDQRAI